MFLFSPLLTLMSALSQGFSILCNAPIANRNSANAKRWARAPHQCAKSKAGFVRSSSMWRVTPPKKNSRNRLLP